MAVYHYVCPGCSDIKTIKRLIKDEEQIPICGLCDRMMRREYSFGITFKGSGFYTTDKNK
jgi:predicted nucleic acid-binding Zn ribbon protein